MIEARELVKKYDAVEAVKGVSFSAERGTVLGLLGPNGAGKTTIMKILTGYHYPSSGSAIVGGIDVTEDPIGVKRLVGYLPESVPLYQELSVAEYLDFAADVRALEGPARTSAKDRAIAACGLEPVYRRPIEQLSKGFRQRLGLAQAILHDPAILILDEPTTGLDPRQIIEIRTLISELGREKTVILSTHILQEVEAICSSVVILNEGRVAAQGEPRAIGEALKGEERLALRVKPTASLSKRELELLVFAIPGFRALSAMEQQGEVWKLEISMSPVAACEPGEAAFDWALANKLKLLELERRRLSLEEIFVKLTSEGVAQ